MISGEKRNNKFGESSNPKRYHYENEEEEEEFQNIPDLDTEIQNDNQLENKVDDTKAPNGRLSSDRTKSSHISIGFASTRRVE
ncbi:hypothetical protein RhiirA1_475532 [Rhizophagus irregularis]|uniref:Uncharacterized protein n=1 Tax=Rhizophagus irregularis TaxID=588596 RepID=A0A2N0QWP1_9GLOM|nr:hypothetical protein RhiirA1_475532 [Rhizophagus irregularis]